MWLTLHNIFVVVLFFSVFSFSILSSTPKTFHFVPLALHWSNQSTFHFPFFRSEAFSTSFILQIATFFHFPSAKHTFFRLLLFLYLYLRSLDLFEAHSRMLDKANTQKKILQKQDKNFKTRRKENYKNKKISKASRKENTKTKKNLTLIKSCCMKKQFSLG